MRCPACKDGDAQEIALADVKIDKCPKCSGVWLDDGEAEKLRDRLPGRETLGIKAAKYKILGEWKVTTLGRPSERECPRCHAKMSTVNFKGIPGLLVERCPENCGFWLDQGEMDKIRLLDWRAVKCPGCGQGTRTETLQGTEIDRCSKCGGIWLDDGEAERLRCKVGSSDPKSVKFLLLAGWRMADKERETERPCPRCGRKLLESNYKGIPGLKVDRCPRPCGMYLDRGELEKVKLV